MSSFSGKEVRQVALSESRGSVCRDLSRVRLGFRIEGLWHLRFRALRLGTRVYS